MIDVNVDKEFVEVIVNLTQKVAKITLHSLEEYLPIPGDCYRYEITTRGAFCSEIICEMEKGLFESVICEGIKGQRLSQNEKELYVTEYLNVICGRVLSNMNNLLRKSSRLSVPQLFLGEISDNFGLEKKVSFESDRGRMNFIIHYEFTDDSGLKEDSRMKRSILVIDDSPFATQQIKDAVEEHEYAVVDFAKNGELGIEKYTKLHPDFVILDIIMPGIDGLETAQRILDYDANAKILMVSSLCDAGTLEEVKKIGVKHLIPKPLEPDVLLATLELMEKSQEETKIE